MAATDDEVVGRVVRAHLIIENFLNSYLVDIFGFEDFGALRLSFSQKAKMLPQSKIGAMWGRPRIFQLNAVRNKYGHRLDHTVGLPAISAIMEVLSVPRSGQEFSTPIDAIEAFAPVACAFLLFPSNIFQTPSPKHSDMFTPLHLTKMDKSSTTAWSA